MTNAMPLESYDGEIFLYYGDISRDGYQKISSAYEARINKSGKVCLVLITYGGDPDAAYRIARASNHHFKEVEILIPDICKSAGTLLCVGAKRLIFGDRGELGPLDIQLSKPDELHESMSGLDIIQAINALQNQVLDSFRTYLVDIRLGSRIRTKTAAEIATQLADGFIAPIAARIDPLTLGEHQRAMQIAYDYGQRLSSMVDSLNSDALVKLVSSYPSHGFVIDRKEAADLFKDVVAPSGPTEEIYTWARTVIGTHSYPGSNPLVIDVKNLLSTAKQNQLGEKENDHTDAKGVEGETPQDNGDAEQKGQNDGNDIAKSDKPKSRANAERGKRKSKAPNKAFQETR